MNLKHDVLVDLEEVEAAVKKAIAGLRACDEKGLTELSWGVGFALGRLRKIADSLYDPKEFIKEDENLH